MKRVLFIFLVVLINSCDYYDNRLEVCNKSNENIIPFFSNDTLIITQNKIEFYIRQIIKPDSTLRRIKPGKNAWSYFIKNSSNKKLNIFIVNADTLLSYNSIDSIKEHRLYKRYEYSEKELEELNWTIVYE